MILPEIFRHQQNTQIETYVISCHQMSKAKKPKNQEVTMAILGDDLCVCLCVWERVLPKILGWIAVFTHVMCLNFV